MVNKIRQSFTTILINIFLFLLFVYSLYPLIWQILASLRTNADLFLNPWGFPDKVIGDNYLKVWSVSAIPQYFWNSIFVSVVSVILILIISSMAAYALSRLNFPGINVIFLVLLSLYFVPQHIALIPLLIIFKTLGISNSPWALILPYVAFAVPFSTIIIRSFILGLPQELLDAAMVDGASKVGVFFRIVLPVIRPVLAVITVVQFVTSWNEFLFALVFLHSREVKTLPIGLMDFVGEYFSDWTAIAAALTIATIPVLVVYILFRNQIISGMTAGSIKG